MVEKQLYQKEYDRIGNDCHYCAGVDLELAKILGATQYTTEVMEDMRCAVADGETIEDIVDLKDEFDIKGDIVTAKR